MLGLRHQVPVYSPISARALATSLSPGGRGAGAAELSVALAEKYGAAAVVLCGSGTEALQLALTAAGAREVALPAFTCYDVATAALGAGAGVRLYDVDPETLAPDVSSVEEAVRAGAGVVVVAPLYGVPVPWAELEALATERGALLVEDAAQGHGASWRGRLLGALGEVSVLSFGRGTGWTGGAGGALLLRGAGARFLEHPDVRRVADAASPATVAPVLAATAQWAVGRPAIYRLPLALPGLELGQTRYHAPRAPRPMPARALALAAATRAEAEEEAVRRRRNALALLGELGADSGATTIRLPDDAVGGYLRLPLRLPRGLASFASPERALRLGVGRSYPTTLAEVPALRPRLLPGGPLPGARRLVGELVTLPTHSRIASWERAEIVAMIRAGEQREPTRAGALR